MHNCDCLSQPNYELSGVECIHTIQNHNMVNNMRTMEVDRGGWWEEKLPM